MHVIDKATLGESRRTRDGYLVVDALIARTGVQIYSGREMARPDLNTVRVYRSPEEVFSDSAMASFTHRPVTNDHPSELVSSRNWKQHSVGMTGDLAAQAGKYIRVPFTLMDQSTIDDVDGGKRELSGGYLCEIDWTPGTTPEGEVYDAQQRKIQGNHLAVVARGRAGSECRIGDSWTDHPQIPMEHDMNLQKVTVDGITVEMSDTAAQVVSKLQTQLRDSDAKADRRKAERDTAKAAHDTALSAKDGELDALKATHAAALSTKDGEIDALKSKLPDAAALDAMLVNRDRVIGTARKMLGDSFDPKGKSDADIRRAAVVKTMGDAAKDKDDSYVLAAFDALATSVTPKSRPDPLRAALMSHDTRPVEANDTLSAHAQMLKRLSTGWESPAVKETV